MLPFDNVLVTVPNVTPARFKELMEWGVAALPGANGRFPQIAGFKITVDTTKHGAGPGRAVQRHHAGPADHVADARRRHEDRRERRASSPGAPSVNLATTNFTANNGDSYPFRDLKGVAAGVPYQQSLYDYIVNELGRAVVDAPARTRSAAPGRIVITAVAAPRCARRRSYRPASRAPSGPCAGR